jgi:DMSO/TMAO reductase YedYZ molybdopterin-dependent catalytic subunit
VSAGRESVGIVHDTAAARSLRRRDALAGVVAAAVALATAELVSGFDEAGTSLVSAVGDEFIDRFAASLKDVAVELFGTNDKVALVVGIVVVALALGAWLGVATRRRPWIGPAGLAAFGLLGFAAYRAAPLADAAIGAVAAIAAAAAGIASLRFLLRLAGGPPDEAAAVGAVPFGLHDGVAAGGTIVAAPASPAMTATDRRVFLVAAASLTAGAAGTAALGRRLRGTDPSADFRATTDLPDPATSTPVDLGEPFTEPGLTPYITPNADFYRIDTALVIPRIDPGSWRLDVTGLVDRPFSLTLDELLALESVEVPVTLQCVSNYVGGDLVGNAVWQGVPLAALLDRAGVQSEGTQVIGRSVDGFTAGFPTELAGDGRPALVAYAMNGELLPPRHGFPARLVVSGLYGYVSATKWLSAIELTPWEDVDGYWIPRGWAKEAPIKTASRIDVPRGGSRLAPGPTAVAGVAWAPTRGISGVEVQVDDGPWEECELGEAANEHTWVQWRLVWDAPPGDHVLRVRAIDGDGDVQTSEVASPAPDGATGLHARRVGVESP